MKTYLYNIIRDKETGLVAAIIKAMLLLLSLIYGLMIKALSLLYLLKPLSLGCKVISVGNITWGGTGKTPLVEYIARLLKAEGYKIVILSRGYKRRKKEGDLGIGSSCQELGDEPYMLKKKLDDIPVEVDADRSRAAKRALRKYSPDFLILDDGFQQWKLKKDLEIVTIDARNPFGNRYLIPRGILREPLSSLKRAGVFVLTKTDLVPDTDNLKSYLGRLNPEALIVESVHSPLDLYQIGFPQERLDLEILKARRIAAISGISDPESFEGLLKKLGCDIALTLRFPDHYNYLKRDFEDMVRKISQEAIDTVITTEKDSARLAPYCLDSINLVSVRFLVLGVQIKIIQNEERFRNRLFSLYPL